MLVLERFRVFISHSFTAFFIILCNFPYVIDLLF